MTVNLLYFALVVGNIMLAASILRWGPRLKILTAAAILLNGLVLLVFLVPITALLLWPTQDAQAALGILLPTGGMVALQLAGLVILFRRTVRRTPGAKGQVER